jgi:hypothetical protein
VCFGQATLKGMSLCVLDRNATEGSHTTAQVSGVFSQGLDLGTLQDAACPAETTWVELALMDNRNRNKLHGILEHSREGRASVVFEGEFYGPPSPDPNLPEAIRKSYHPNWGYSNCCRTKLVVHLIRDVKAVLPLQGGNGSHN